MGCDVVWCVLLACRLLGGSLKQLFHNSIQTCVHLHVHLTHCGSHSHSYSHSLSLSFLFSPFPHRIVKLVRAIRKGWLKVGKQRRSKPQEQQVYLLWGDDDQVGMRTGVTYGRVCAYV